MNTPELIKFNRILASATTLNYLTAYLEQQQPLRGVFPGFATYRIFFRKNTQVGEGDNKFAKTLKKICLRISFSNVFGGYPKVLLFCN